MKAYFLELFNTIIGSIFQFFHYLILGVMNLILTLSMGCHHESSTFPENYSFGTIETANRIFDQTRVRLYNEEGKILDSVIVKMGGIYEGFIPPSIGFNHFLYSPVEGTFTKGERALFRFDLETGEVRIHEYNNGIRTILADNIDPNIVFFIDYNDDLIKWDTQKNQEIKTKKVSNYIHQHLQQDQQKIYFFGQLDYLSVGSFKNEYHLLIIDKNTLEIETTIDLTEHGAGQLSSLILDKTLFFANGWRFTEKEGLIGNNILSALDLNTYEITDYALGEEFPYHIAYYNHSLIINHAMAQTPQMKKISVFNLDTHQSQFYQLGEDSNFGFYQIAVQDHYLYALESYNLHKYDIENNFEEVAIYPVKTPFGSKTYPTFGNSSHVSAFFLNPKND